MSKTIVQAEGPVVGEPPMDVVRYYAGDDGSVGVVRAQVESACTIPPGTQEITQEEYERRLAEIREVNRVAVETQQEADAQRQRSDYEQLTGVGLSPELAARLSGHTPGGA